MVRRVMISLVMVAFFMCGLPAQDPVQPLFWDANSEVDLEGYWAYRALTPCTFVNPDPNIPAGPVDCPQFSRLNTAIIPQAADPINFVDNGPLDFQIHYFYRVTAQNTSGLESQFSNELDTVHVNPNAPASPGGLRGTELGANMWLDWNDTQFADAYNVYKSSQEVPTGSLIATTEVSDHRDINQGRIGPRWYWVTSLNDVGESPPSGPVIYVGK